MNRIAKLFYIFQDSSHFYLFYGVSDGGPNWQLKRVSSSTGSTPGTQNQLGHALRSQQSVAGQTEVLWIHTTGSDNVRTWKPNTPYTYKICHIPDYTADAGLINLKIYESGTLIHETKDILDKSPNRLNGGKLGVFVDSQKMVKWFGISYGCASQSQCS